MIFQIILMDLIIILISGLILSALGLSGLALAGGVVLTYVLTNISYFVGLFLGHNGCDS